MARERRNPLIRNWLAQIRVADAPEMPAPAPVPGR